MVRTSLEVLLGERVVYECIDFNSGKARVFVGNRNIEILFIRDRDDLISLYTNHKWHMAVFEEPNLVKVSLMNRTLFTRDTVAGQISMRWVGRSFVDRWEEPLFLRQARYCAEVRGLTLEQLLKP